MVPTETTNGVKPYWYAVDATRQCAGSCLGRKSPAIGPDDKVWRYLVYLKYWTLNFRPLMVYPEVLFPPNFIIKGNRTHSLSICQMTEAEQRFDLESGGSALGGAP